MVPWALECELAFRDLKILRIAVSGPDFPCSEAFRHGLSHTTSVSRSPAQKLRCLLLHLCEGVWQEQPNTEQRLFLAHCFRSSHVISMD